LTYIKDLLDAGRGQYRLDVAGDKKVGTLSSYLDGDHRQCDALLRRASAVVHAAQWPEARRAMAAFQNALERHLLIEERVLFPAFERSVGCDTGPTSAMRGEHLRIRAVAQRLANSVQARDADAFATHAEVLLLVMHQHGEKEDGVLYPMIERVLGQRCEQVLDAMRAFRTLDTCEFVA
jgi:hemerythrin-like domain-containing protein